MAFPSANHGTTAPSEPQSDLALSIMCDIAGLTPLKLNPEKQTELARLINDGLVQDSNGATDGYKITDKGQRLLDDRGVGVTES